MSLIKRFISEFRIGELIGFKDQPPAGCVPCDGRALSIGEYPELFAVIGTVYGGGTGTFNLPDWRGGFAGKLGPAAWALKAKEVPSVSAPDTRLPQGCVQVPVSRGIACYEHDLVSAVAYGHCFTDVKRALGAAQEKIKQLTQQRDEAISHAQALRGDFGDDACIQADDALTDLINAVTEAAE